MSHEDTKDMGKHFYRASAADFLNIPGSPIAYWATENTVNTFINAELMSGYTPPKKGIDTGNNDLFLRFWFEVSRK